MIPGVAEVHADITEVLSGITKTFRGAGIFRGSEPFFSLPILLEIAKFDFCTTLGCCR